MRKWVFLVLLFVPVALFCSCQDAPVPTEEDAIRQIVIAYRAAKIEYNVEKQLDLISTFDRKKVDYVTLQNAQPGEFTRMLCSRYTKYKILKITVLPEKPNRATAMVEFNGVNFIEVAEKYSSLSMVTHLKIQGEILKNLSDKEKAEISTQDLLQKEIKKIYYGQALPMKISKKEYLLVKEPSGWKIELIKDHWL